MVNCNSLSSLKSSAGQVEPQLVENSEDRFSRFKAQVQPMKKWYNAFLALLYRHTYTCTFEAIKIRATCLKIITMCHNLL